MPAPRMNQRRPQQGYSLMNAYDDWKGWREGQNQKMQSLMSGNMDEEGLNMMLEEMMPAAKLPAALMGITRMGSKVITPDIPVAKKAGLLQEALPMNQSSRMQRAKDMGFNTDRPLYHGTSDDIKEFDIKHPNRHDWGWIGEGTYVSDYPAVANSYANLKGGAGNPNVMPMYSSVQNPMRITQQEKNRIFQQGPEGAEAFKQKAIDDGYDAIEVMTPKGELLEMNVFDPSKLRSINATFDPAKKGSKDLLSAMPNLMNGYV